MAEMDKPKRRVSLFAVLMVITCIVCYLAGHLNGYRLRRAEEKLTRQSFVRTYSVPVAPELATDPKSSAQILDDVVSHIREGVMPSVWSRKESPCSIAPNPATKGIVVSAEADVHTAIAAFLSHARDLRIAR